MTRAPAPVDGERLQGGPVRAAVPDDEPALRHLQSLLPEPSPALLSYGLAAGTEPHGSATNTVLVSTAGAGRPVGYLLAIHGDDTHLAELVVAPAFRRAGRASALLTALLARRPDGERVTLAVAADNDPARSLYREFGFEQVDSSETLFEDGTALLFERSV